MIINFTNGSTTTGVATIQFLPHGFLGLLDDRGRKIIPFPQREDVVSIQAGDPRCTSCMQIPVKGRCDCDHVVDCPDCFDQEADDYDNASSAQDDLDG